jgi:tetratricopeptide (TPR) repeat protein
VVTTSVLRPAVHRTIVCVDVEGFGDRRRTNVHQAVVRNGLYQAVETAFERADIAWSECYHEDRGDGIIILVPPEISKSRIIVDVAAGLIAELGKHNQRHELEARIRLRIAVHAGEIHYDRNGIVGSALNFTFRLLEAHALKRALSRSSGVLAIIASQWFFEEVIRHTPTGRPDLYRSIQVAVKETIASAWICLPDDPYMVDGNPEPVPMSVTGIPRQLPSGIAGFSGRVAELELLTELINGAGGSGGTVVISAVDGTAGIGKTTVAVHWAHNVARQFPDGQLYVNLRGFEPAGSPATSAEVLRNFLASFQVPPELIPIGREAQAALYRSILADRRVLVVLDNAYDVDQVLPLLPGSDGCVVVVTSRNRLTGLITRHNAKPITLDLLPAVDARMLLARRIGVERVAAETQAVDEIIISCARLPLALSIVAARAAAHPSFSMAALAAELREALNSSAGSGLRVFDGGDSASNVRAVFSWSYQRLGSQAAWLFRLLGLHPGPDLTMSSASSLACLSVDEARDVLAELARAHMIEEVSPGRFAFHDLLRVYAKELARVHDPESARRESTHRMLDYYLHNAYAAALRLYPLVEPIPLSSPSSGVVVREFADYEAAWNWFEAEQQVLLAVAQHAAAERTPHAWQLPWTLQEYFRRLGRWQDWLDVQQTALACVQNRDDNRGQAYSHHGLGRAYTWLGRYDEARVHLQLAGDLFEKLDDKTGQASTHIDMASTFEASGNPAKALVHAREALRFARATADLRGQAKALNNTGWYFALLGEPRNALLHCEEALVLHRKIGNRRGEANTLDSIAYAQYQLNQFPQAITYYRKALTLKIELGDRHGQARTLTRLGDALHGQGLLAEARGSWRSALETFEEIGHSDVDQVRARLHQLDLNT